MTTPERLRARQRRESAFIALLAVALVVAVLVLNARDAQQKRCLTTFVKRDSVVGKIRSKLVERESVANRTVIRAALTAESREDLIAARETYFRALKAIDKARADHPVRPFPEGVCD